MLRRVADRVAHVVQATLVDEVDNQLEFVQALEVCDLGLISSFNQSFETGFDQVADSAAKHGLLTEKVGLRFLGEGGFEHTGSGASERSRV